jgi:hypothetical protein
MFRNDYNLINEAYDNLKEFTGSMGVNGDNAPGSGLSPEKIKKVIVTAPINKPGTKNPQPAKITPVKDSEGCEECGGACGVEKEDTDSDTYMAKQLCYRIFKLATMMYGLLAKGGCDAKVEAWVLSKITNAHDSLNSVFGYKDFEDFKKSIQSMGGFYEETELDLYNALNKGGTDLISVIRDVLKRESKETKQQVFAEVIKLLDS